MQTDTTTADKQREDINRKARELFATRMQDPAYRERRNERRRNWNHKASANPRHVENVRKKNRESEKRRMLNPEYREKMKRKRAAYNHRPPGEPSRAAVLKRRRRKNPLYREAVNRAERERRKKLRKDPNYRRVKAQKDRVYSITWRPGYRKRKMAADPLLRLRSRFSARVRRALIAAIGSGRCSGSRLGYLGCTVLQLMRFLELKFQPGMTWDNYGKVWHIDHIKPVSVFDLTEEDQRHLAFGYQNLQPLNATENVVKSNKWWPQYTQLLLLI